jgi:hypothetical protein
MVVEDVDYAIKTLLGEELPRPKNAWNEREIHYKEEKARKTVKIYKSSWPDGEAPKGAKVLKGKRGGEYYLGDPDTGEPADDTDSDMDFDDRGMDEPDDEQTTGELSDDPKELRNTDSQLVETQLRLKKGDEQDKGGLGTPESRTGETVTVYAAKKVQELIKKGMSYKEAREEVKKELLKIAKEKDSLLTNEWIESGLNCLDWIENNYGPIEDLEEIVWDTPQGNKLIDTTGHGTSADMFIKTKDGKRIGISLKKNFKVFIVNGGFDTQIKNVAKMLGIDPEELPENIRPGYYNKRRAEVLDDGIPKLNQPNVEKLIKKRLKKALKDPLEAKKIFGKAHEKRINYIAARKAGISLKAFKELSSEEQQKMIGSLTPNDVYDSVINAKPLKGDDIKVIANIAKISEVNEITKLYTDLRDLDNEMADNLMEFLNDGENLNKFKELVSTETHIEDILFGSEGDSLDKLEVLYGEDNGVSMSPEAITNLFDMSDLYGKYKNAKTEEEKEEIKKQIQKQVKEKMVITREKGKPVIAVRVKNPNPPPYESILPIFGMGTRTKGIGASNGLEIYQSSFGSLAFKNGNTDIENWDEGDRKKVVNDQVKTILNDIEDENVDVNSEEGMIELRERIELLERWDAGNSLLTRLKDRYDL